jgi:hypothetical protein
MLESVSWSGSVTRREKKYVYGRLDTDKTSEEVAKVRGWDCYSEDNK